MPCSSPLDAYKRSGLYMTDSALVNSIEKEIHPQPMLFAAVICYARCGDLRQVLQNESARVTLDIAALELASIEFPRLDFEASLFRLDTFADQIRPKINHRTRGLEFIRQVNDLLFDSLQFRGNEGDYYDPRNSCLNAVLSRRLGIPISPFHHLYRDRPAAGTPGFRDRTAGTLHRDVPR